MQSQVVPVAPHSRFTKHTIGQEQFEEKKVYGDNEGFTMQSYSYFLSGFQLFFSIFAIVTLCELEITKKYC